MHLQEEECDEEDREESPTLGVENSTSLLPPIPHVELLTTHIYIDILSVTVSPLSPVSWPVSRYKDTLH